MSVTERHINIYKTAITALRQSIGRIAKIYLEPTTEDCDWCIYDPVSKTSTGMPQTGFVWDTHPNYTSGINDVICPNCSGKGTIDTQTVKEVMATRKDLDYNDSDDAKGIKFKPGTLRLSCDLYDVLVDTSDPTGDTWFQRATKVEYDGDTYEVVNYSKSGLRDLYTFRVILERTNK